MKTLKNYLIGGTFFSIILIFCVLINDSPNFTKLLNNNDYVMNEEQYKKEIIFNIDLKNLKSNNNLLIFKEDNCLIIIKEIVKNDLSDQITIMFKSIGSFTKNEGKIYTGNSYLNPLTNPVTLKYKDINFYYSIKHYGANKDGDYFGFSIPSSYINETNPELILNNLSILYIKKRN